MSKVYFHKSGRSAIHYRNGTRIPFEALADAQSVLALEDTQTSEIADIQAYITKKLGGVSAITEERYEELKKNLPFNPGNTYAQRTNKARLLDMDNMVPKSPSPSASAARAVAPGDAVPAVASAPVRPAAGPVDPAKGPVSRGRAVRTNKPAATAKPAATEPAEPIFNAEETAPATSTPTAGETAPQTSETPTE